MATEPLLRDPKVASYEEIKAFVGEKCHHLAILIFIMDLALAWPIVNLIEDGVWQLSVVVVVVATAIAGCCGPLSSFEHVSAHERRMKLLHTTEKLLLMCVVMIIAGPMVYYLFKGNRPWHFAFMFVCPCVFTMCSGAISGLREGLDLAYQKEIQSVTNPQKQGEVAEA
jgi:hypothetical protein